MKNNKYSPYKIVWFNEKLESFANGEVIAPIYVRIKPTNRCLHNCYFCVYRSEFSQMHDTCNKTDQLSKEKLLETVDDLKNIGTKAVTLTGGGEPLFHPNITEIIDRINKIGLDNSVITNGQLLSGERAEALKNAKWIRVSMDYHDEDSFEKSRRVPSKLMGEIFKNIRNFAKIKNKNCDLAVNFIVTQENHLNLFDTAKKLKDHGIENIRFSPLWLPGFEEYHKPLEENVSKQIRKSQEQLTGDGFTVYHSYNIKTQAQKRTCKRCFVMQTNPVIAADSNVYTCHNKAYDKSGLIGSIKDRKFSDLWFSPEAKEVFEKFNPIENCSHHQCAGDQKNILVNQFLEARDDNFV